MELFNDKPDINFVGLYRYAMIISMTLITLSTITIVFRGVNMGLDFTGGFQIQVHYIKNPVINSVIEKMLYNNIHSSQIANLGQSNDIVIKLPSRKLKVFYQSDTIKSHQFKQRILKTKVEMILGENAEIVNLNYIGPKAGKELIVNGSIAFLIAMIFIINYITFRFTLKFALSAAISLVHDVIIILGIFSMFQFEFDLTVLSGIMATIGYSLNDTIVIYDRIREKLGKETNMPIITLINHAVNDTLSRTIITSGSTLLVVVLLYFLGGLSLHGLSVTLILGVIIGTYSSIYIAGALTLIISGSQTLKKP